MRHLPFVLLIALVTITSCAHWDDVDPRSREPVAGNACGNLGVPCLDMAGNLDGWCCATGNTCGGGKYSVGCPADSCCDIDDSQGGGYGAKRMTKKWKAGYVAWPAKSAQP